MSNIFKREPIAIVGGIIAVLAILAAFGVGVTAEQQDILSDNLVVIFTLIAGGTVAARQSVVAPANVAVQMKDGQLVAGDAVEIPTGTPVTVAQAPVPDDPFR